MATMIIRWEAFDDEREAIKKTSRLGKAEKVALRRSHLVAILPFLPALEGSIGQQWVGRYKRSWSRVRVRHSGRWQTCVRLSAAQREKFQSKFSANFRRKELGGGTVLDLGMLEILNASTNSPLTQYSSFRRLYDSVRTICVSLGTCGDSR